MTIPKPLLSALALPEDTTDEEEVSTTFVALVNSAVHDHTPRRTMAEIHRLIVDLGGTPYLDALHLVPLLLPSGDPAAKEILSIIGECGSAKEVVMATEEALEKLDGLLDEEDEASDDENEDSNAVDTKKRTPLEQLAIAMDLLAAAIPRIKLRKKTPSETIRVPLAQLEATLGHAANIMKEQATALQIISSASLLATACWRWVQNLPNATAEEAIATKAILSELLDTTVTSYTPFVQASVAQRTLEAKLAQLKAHSQIPPNWKASDETIDELFDTYNSIGIPITSNADLVPCHEIFFLAHRPPTDPLSSAQFRHLVPKIISNLHSGRFIDESLAILLRFLSATQTTHTTLSSDVSVPLFSVVPILASSHPHPPIRHQAFRILSLLVSVVDPQITFENLCSLTKDLEFPQMRAASVGLVKQAVLQALEKPAGNPFAGPSVLRAFGPILFRPNPPDLLQNDILTLEEFKETHEAERLTECLAFYYVLVQRDKENLTGIRDSSTRRALESNLVVPLKARLSAWLKEPATSTPQSQPHDIMPLVSLQIGLERIESIHG